MPDLWLPNAAADAILADQGNAEADRFVGFRNRLKAMDPRMGAFLCDKDMRNHPEYRDLADTPDLRVGFYYLYRRNDNGTVAFWEISNPDGSYREPDDALIDALQKIDRDTLQDLRARRAEKARRKEKREQETRELNLAKLQDQTDYAFRVQHAFPSLPWKK